ncbi:MAG: prolipoprotein diacylglyceryl transferase [Ignavibacteria bacterium]|nr:prolipoprotein diacylglyceryl transferase [Ignavibacteria bacterium]
MCPKLFEFGPFTLYSYGLMVAIGFFVANYFFVKELQRKLMNVALANTVTILAIVFGIIGAKLLYVVENLEYTSLAPLEMIFSPSGLTYYGGFFLATIAIFVYARKKNYFFLQIADAISPSLILGYGIARLGCHFSGDGDYGFPTTLPWGTDYSNGTYPPSYAFKDFPEVTRLFSDGVVPDTTLCHPTPVYELFVCTFLFYVLWKMRSKVPDTGLLFSYYLIFAGIERFAIEFLRLNKRVAFGLSEAQLISLFLIALGIYVNYAVKKKNAFYQLIHY